MNSNVLRDVRKEIGMPLSELARRANVSRTTITNIELRGTVPKGDVMLSISAALKKTQEKFFLNLVLFVNSKKKVEEGGPGV